MLVRLDQQDIPGTDIEIIVINDGSTDDTQARLEDRSDLYSRLINLEFNRGKGAAVKAGLAVATGEFVVFQDADLEYDPADLIKLLEPVLQFDADLVIGSRFIAPPVTRVFYFWNKFGNRLITFTFNILNNTTFTDIYSCYLLYRRSLVNPQRLKTEGWEQHAEILSLAVQEGNSFFEVPISYFGRTVIEGKKIRPWHAIAVLSTIIRCRLLK